MKSVGPHSRIWAKIDLDAVVHNLNEIKKHITSDTQLIAVIKADAYGHGALAIADKIKNREELWGFAVATVEEGVTLREGGIQNPILILGYVFPENYETVVTYDLQPAVFTVEMAELLSKAAQKQEKSVKVHIKIDTGMSRIGFQDNAENIKQIERIFELPGLEPEGIFTHLARADEADPTFTQEQFDRFKGFVGNCKTAGILFKLCHCSNSAGILAFPEIHMDAVRAGIILYGLSPSSDMSKEAACLKPVLSLYSQVAYVKELAPGTPVSYGGTYITDCVQRIATIPAGYGDGYPRQLSNRGYVLIHGKKAPIRGRVCMDQMMVDVTGIPDVQEGTRVTLVGEDQDAHITVEELGELSGRFNYEFVCCLTKRVPRIYYEREKSIGMSW